VFLWQLSLVLILLIKRYVEIKYNVANSSILQNHEEIFLWWYAYLESNKSARYI
jgi:hypothetical protein